VGHLNLQVNQEGKAQDSSAGFSKRPREERRRRNRGNKKEETFAVTAAPANGKPGFKGKCYTCGQEGHVKANCSQKPKDGATSGRKPGAVCNFCHKRDSHTEDECWEKHPEKKPEKWRKKEGGGAKQAYAAGAEPSAPEAEPKWSPYMAWGASVQPGGGALDALAIFTDDVPKLRATTLEQRDTTPAARAKGEAARVAARAKEEQGRVGGPPPGFKPKGKRAAPAAEGAGQTGPAGRRRQAPEPAAAAPARVREYGPNDPRYQGLTDAEQVGVRMELLDPPKTRPVTGDVVRRKEAEPVGALSAFHADVLPAEEEGGTGGGAESGGVEPANAPLVEEMGGADLPFWESENRRRQQFAREQRHEGELDHDFVHSEKPHLPLPHEGEGVPWKPPVPLTQKGLGYVKTFLTAIAKSRRDGLPSHHENHTTEGHIMPKRSGQRHGSWSDLKKPQLYGFLCHLGREWVRTFANLPEGDDGARRFSAEERTYRLQAMQYLVSNMAEHYATLPNQPNL
jgi:hypothetical protein